MVTSLPAAEVQSGGSQWDNRSALALHGLGIPKELRGDPCGDAITLHCCVLVNLSLPDPHTHSQSCRWRFGG